ncbi:MAG: magnesium transporter CorA family protein [Methanosphaera stadtmanae]|nr:magnesium transporter CorA family protein [Methanosphaera stadtmanae]
MLNVYTTTKPDRKLIKSNEIQLNSWIELVDPDLDELDYVIETTGVASDLLYKMLDEEERPRVEMDDCGTLIVIDTPFLEDSEEAFSYITRPLGIIVTKEHYVITIAPKEVKVLDNFRLNRIRNFRTAKKTRFVIQILLKTAESYQRALKVVNRTIESKEEILSKSTNNDDLLDMLELEKTLVYFITALNANDSVLKKLNKGFILPLYEGDDDLLEDAIIENRQAIDQSALYREILSSITDTYATVVSNNLNNVMKFLTGVTIILAIPTMLFSFMGMNVPFTYLGDNPYSVYILILVALFLSITLAMILKMRDML